jgi:hypothetical protein
LPPNPRKYEGHGDDEMAKENFPVDTRKRFAAIRERARRLGVLDIRFNRGESPNILECYERTLDIIEKNKEVLDQNAQEAGFKEGATCQS